MKPAFFYKALFVLITTSFSFSVFSQTSLIPYGSSWKYLDNGSNQGTAWRASGFNDAGWVSGNAELGYGDGDETTVVSYGPSSSNKYITTYFRKSVNIPNPAIFSNFTLNVEYDDGAVVYVNGTEVGRVKITGTVAYNTLADNPAIEPDAIASFTIPVSSFVAGNNVIAVEIHQQSVASSDLSFNLELIGNLTPTTLLNISDAWKYLDNGSNQNTAWRATGFNDVSWAAGPGQLGYGDGDEATVVSHGGCTPIASCGPKPVTTYFRKTFNITGINNYSGFTFSLFRDDGAIVYINGQEVYTTNISSGAAFNTLATTASDDGNTAQVFNITGCSGYLVEGSNTIAVEIHQSSLTSSDLTFALAMVANPSGVGGTPTLTRGPYLQSGSETALTLRWRTNTACYGRVRVGLVNGTYTTASADETCATTEHIVRVTGLTSDTKYFYQISATDGTILQGAADNFFTTNPPTNTTRKTRIIAFGDCGRGDVARQDDNLTNYQNYLTANSIDAPDAWILLGDNAYSTGSDPEYTSNFFNIYGSTLLKNHKLYPAPGNHDYGNNAGNKASRSMPYHQNFTVPQNGEAGGVASNHQNYYSYNVGNIHFLSLDSYGTESDATSMETSGGSALKTWIDADLAANTSKWIVAYWHHPPYTKGSHNSDSEGDLVNIRQNFITFLEARGVDMIICGHTHVYERGYLIKNYTGNWGSFNLPTHAVSSSSATYTSNTTCPYVYNTSPANHGTVYVVEGSTGAGWSGNTSGFISGPMPFSVNDGGVFYFEVEDNRLDAKMLRRDGSVFDRFTIIKDANKTTNYNIVNGASQSLTASWPKTGNYSWTNAAGSGRTVSVTPPNNSTTNYEVTDEYGCVTDQYSITTTGTLPVSLVSYDVRLNNSKVDVTWSTATETNNKYFTIERSANGTDFVAIGTVNGAGTSSSVNNYSFVDIHPLTGVSFYRLTQTDIDDHKQYLRVKQIVNNKGKDFDVRAISVGSGMLSLQINSSDQSVYQLRIFDMSGRERKNEIINCTAGMCQKEFLLEAGIFVCEIINSRGQKLSQKVLVK